MMAFDTQGEFTGDTFRRFVRYCTEVGASDILIQSGDVAWVEIHGRQHRGTTTTITHAHVQALLASQWGADVEATVRGGEPADRSFQLVGEADGLARGQVMRFRVNVTQARVAKVETAFSITMRTIPQELPDIDKMGIEEELFRDFFPAKGLILVCGPTGSGKTTLQAGVYAYVGRHMPDRKTVVIEDPIEYVLGGPHWNGPQPAQSELGRDVRTFADGLRGAMRRKPSIIGIGEIRDLETCDAAIEAGLTGHLCYATMHTDSCGETINRAIQIYPPAQQSSVASRLLGAVRVIVVQRLLKTTDGKRRAIREFVIFDREFRSLLQKRGYEQWAGMIDDHLRARGGTLDDKAWALLGEGVISREEFVELAGSKALRDRLESATADNNGTGA